MIKWHPYAGACVLGLIVGIGVRGSNREPLSQPTESESTSLLGERGSTKSPLEEGLSGLPMTERWLAMADRVDRGMLPTVPQLAALDSEELKKAITLRWAERDPESLLEALVENGQHDRRYFEVLFEHWMGKDPDAAIRTLQDERFQRYSSYAMWEAFKHDPSLGFRVMKAFQQHNLGFSDEWIRDWKPQDPQAAAELLADIPYSRDLGAGLRYVGRACAKQDPRGALDFATSLNPSLSDTFSESVMQAWVETRPDDAQAYVAAHSNLDEATKRGFALGLAKADPKASLAWVEANLQSTARANAVAAVVKEAVGNDMERATLLIADMPAGGALTRTVETLVKSWELKTEAERERILSWVDGVPDPEAQRRAVKVLNHNLLSLGKNGLADFVAGPYGHLALPEQVEDATIQKAREDADTALAWAKRLPPDRQMLALEAIKKEQR